MGSYEGPAELITGDGTAAGDVVASLVSPEEASTAEPWFGTVSGTFDAFDLMEGSPSLVLPDGREGSFRLTRMDLVTPRMGVRITGTGPPPF